jgi:type IV pilus biogenesis protein PilP
MKISLIPKNKIIGFTLVMVVASSLASVMYFFNSTDKPAQKMTQSVIQAGGLTPTEAQTDAKAVTDLAPVTPAIAPLASKPEVTGLTKGEEVVKASTQPGRDGSAAVTNKKPAAAPDSSEVKPSAPAAANTSETSSPQKPTDWAAPTLGDLEKLRSENAMLAEQLKGAELKTKIAKEGSVPGILGTSNPNAVQSPGPANSAKGPRVLMIAGGENNYRANVSMPNGQTITASVGTAHQMKCCLARVKPNDPYPWLAIAPTLILLWGNKNDSSTWQNSLVSWHAVECL